ncbi:MAG: hypothetical protein ABI920_03555 [Casimicrobiaceae bacterium]
MEARPADHRELIIMWAFAKLDVAAFAAATAIVSGATLFLLTVALVFKGASPGIPVGPHLGELAAVFPGFAVTYAGSFIGAIYAALVGAVLGVVVASIWNAAHAIFLALVRMRANLATYEMD